MNYRNKSLCSCDKSLGGEGPEMGVRSGKSPGSAWSPAWVAKPEVPHQALALEELMEGPLGNCCPWGSTALCLIVALGPLLGMEASSQEEELIADQRSQRADLASDHDHI